MISNKYLLLIGLELFGISLILVDVIFRSGITMIIGLLIIIGSLYQMIVNFLLEGKGNGEI